MIKTVILSFIQSALSVGGITLLHHVLEGRGHNVIELLTSLLSIRGIAGAILLFGAFAVMTYMLTFVKFTIFIPLNTATTFLLTVVIGLLQNTEKPSWNIVVGMVFVLSGIAVIAGQRQ
jgi:drug/metabolite transporter (DMT)-like permease